MTNLQIKLPVIAIAFIGLSGSFNEARAYPNCTGEKFENTRMIVSETC